MIPSLTPTGITSEEPVEWYNPQNVMPLRPFVLSGLNKVE
jgi:hypothetical protein